LFEKLTGDPAHFHKRLSDRRKRNFKVLGVFDTVAPDDCHVIWYAHTQVTQAAVSRNGHIVVVTE
jgi:hypothetical protein